MPVLDHTTLQIDSENTFPHSSGIASSASAMGALAMCLTEMEARILGHRHPVSVARKASFVARLGSGSACRSLFPGFSLWGASPQWEGSSNEYAIPIPRFHESFSRIRDTILIVESGPKQVSSSTGHELMNSHLFADPRFSQARENLILIIRALQEGDWETFINVLEEEALSLHAMMLTSRPGYLLMRPNTLAIIHKIRGFRNETGIAVGFTLDAGANVHLLYPDEVTESVEEQMMPELITYCENGRIIRDQIGDGPKKLNDGTSE
jgi:diphosphomevalonate decarboxylase